jgi:8-oxo-dGTP pyrophosphatase MutT (NUDIX family)
VSVKPPPAVPAPAATLVLLRDRPGGGVETLLIQRHRASKFAGGDFVFPGGKIEPHDAPDEAPGRCAGLDPAVAAARLGLAGDRRAAIAYWVGAIREAFEEVGILLAYGPDGNLASLAGSCFADYRRACQLDHRVFWQMVRDQGLTLATDRLAYFAHWITPEEHPFRFDTRFFAAETPAGQDAEADDREIVAVRWLTPAEALAARARGEVSLRLPTISNLTIFDGAPSVKDALARLQGLRIDPIRPRLVMESGQPRAILPGEPGWY